MKIAILSDSHESQDNLVKALKAVTEKGIDTILFCGDFCSPKIVRLLAENFKGQVHIVFGNNDGDRFNQVNQGKKHEHLKFHGEYASMELGGKRIGMTHYPFYATAMAKSGDFDLVAFGHDHDPRILAFGQAVAVNPGSLYENDQNKPLGYAIYDTEAHKAVLYPLDWTTID